MEGSIGEKLLSAIKKDDVKTFGQMTEEIHAGNYRLGRFPVLSLVYLYGARRIAAAYETRFLKISSWEPLDEPAETSALFAAKAGKCLRLYLNEIVSPVEMLLILDKTRRVKKVFPIAKPSEAIKRRLKSIYNIKYALNMTFAGQSVHMDRRPLNRRERQKFCMAIIGCVLVLAILIAAPVTAATLLPNRAKGEIAKLKHIDFASQRTYTVVKDIVIPDDFYVDSVKCSFKGGGGKLIFGKNATLGFFYGKLTDIEIETAGSPIFQACTNLAELNNVVVNVNSDIEIADDSAFVALANYGTMKNVTLNASGSVTAREKTDENSSGVVFGGIVANNTYVKDNYGDTIYGTLTDCRANYSDLRLSGALEANSSFGGVAGINNGIIDGCTVSGDVIADTFDLAGVCYGNGYIIKNSLNEANLSQTSLDNAWSPVVGGVVIENAGQIEYCKNSGDLSAKGVSTVICGGVVARTYRFCNYCVFDGSISVEASEGYVGGIFGRSEAVIPSSGLYVYIGITDHCLSLGSIKADLTSDGAERCVGGIGGKVEDTKVTYSTPNDDEDAIVEYWGGSATNCIFAGTLNGKFEPFGNIVGVVGANVYEKNSYTSQIGVGQTVENPYFDGNLYVSNGSAAFGAAVNDLKELSTVADKGASALSAAELKISALYNEILAEVLAALTR